MKALTYVEVDVPAFVLPEEDLETPTLVYNFTTNSLVGWTGAALTATATANGATLVPTGPDPIFRSPAALAINGASFPFIRLDIERTALRTLGVWDGHLFWVTAGHGESGSFFKNIPEVPNVVGARQIILLDMSTNDSSGAADDWIANTITQLRLDLDDGQVGAVTPNGQFLIRSISVGASLERNRGATFDGSAVYATRTAGLTGAADSKQLTLSAWVRPESTTLQSYLLTSSESLAGAADRFLFNILAGGQVQLFAKNAAGTAILNIFSAGVLPLDTWSHVLISVDMSAPAKRHLYINGVSDLQVTTFTDGTLDFTSSDWSVAAGPNAGNKFDGSLADVWFNPGVYMDFANRGIRAKFYSAKNGPENLGQYGELPTGTSPLVFMSGAYSTWRLNKGKGGGFSATGLGTAPAFEITETHRFTLPVEYLPPSIDAVPSMKPLSFNPASVSLGTDLGIRASITATFGDHPHRFDAEPFDQGSYWGKWRGRYGTKLRNCRFRVIRGLVGQALADMDIRHYMVDTTDGPTPEGVYTMTAKDTLKLADDARSQAPNISNGSLAGSINNSVTSATLSPVGIGVLEYPASGWVCIGGKEIVSFTRAADVLTIARAQLGTSAIAHSSGDRMQLVLRYTGNDVADIIYDLLTKYVAGITPAMIDLDEWHAETAAYLAVIYAATISEATSVKKLLIELIDQAALALFWDDRAQLIRLRVLREISTDTDTFDEERIVLGSLSVKEQPDKRISQIWCYYGQRDPSDQADNQDNYRAALASVDLERETEYGTPAIIKVPSRWVETLTAATRLNSIKLSRFRDPPRAFSFQLFRDQQIALAQGYQVSWWGNQDRQGIRLPAKIQVTKIRVESDYTFVEAEEMLASGVIVLLNVVFLTTTGALLDFVVPDSWNDADNSIEVLAAGGNGGTDGGVGCKGGAGGGYSAIFNLNLMPGAIAKYQVGAVAGDSWFNGNTLALSSVGAKGGSSGVGRTGGGVGGLASGGVGTLKTSGGDGGNGGNSNDNPEGGGGGGGAGGPHGDGADGGAGGPNSRNGGGGGSADGGSPGVQGDSVGVGGNNRFGFGGGNVNEPGIQGAGAGGGNLGTPGGASSSEQLWTQTIAPITSAGPSGGGGGGGSFNPGGSAQHGGGGGGGSQGGSGGTAGLGLIVVSWRQ